MLTFFCRIINLKYAEEFKVDDPTKEGEHIGPVISETQYNKIQTLIQKGIDEGAKLVAGGPGKPEGINQGYFVKPTVFADVNNNMEIARTEIFGPVLSVIPFKNEEEAIKIAHDTPYGLTNYIQTQDPEKVKRVSRRVRSGMVDVNGAGIAVDAPFGGFKHSGIGREAGQHGLEEFLEVKAVGGWTNYFNKDFSLTPSKNFRHFLISFSSINSSILCACSIEPGPQTTVLIPIS